MEARIKEAIERYVEWWVELKAKAHSGTPEKADYTVGKADFATLYQSEVDLLDLERTQRLATVRTHIEQAVARETIGATPQGDQP